MRKIILMTLMLLMATATTLNAYCPDVGSDSTRTIWSSRCGKECPNEGCTSYNAGTNCATYSRIDSCCTWCNRFGQCTNYNGNYAEVTACFS
jgi:hypothetical protein